MNSQESILSGAPFDWCAAREEALSLVPGADGGMTHIGRRSSTENCLILNQSIASEQRADRWSVTSH